VEPQVILEQFIDADAVRGAAVARKDSVQTWRSLDTIAALSETAAYRVA